ncbi:hypothetical protein A2348_00050 [Candidatus Uhrbacteria bacterium RIFOXYB12_FULL_58_10]|uniref:Sporulation stage II protein D amidase enhancer LytB N-terminal domain-containing protein n=1 Tax=Candidatus Uhrbacteria bacterium RIFOXYB2_FULL_57_15 TaxID=1802422 RepID=A0A1F7W6X7_9BACT|nr:MAG: hypothetical protein A2348_00050 [Candidatus Uhrbacteria bacterium RIFOXYB12_FULL_58_10]OGL98128.1 MAG: hypothetical protein A2304_03555 [Candidatus Uhrbacteria bacterium RIFOXYB2_FULL_57_15]OGM00112.1 MAG: hypothetical protein A2501_01210 [Candidatus Uhrbacteria bacterium RIFOXYC12_FULL_57_11]
MFFKEKKNADFSLETSSEKCYNVNVMEGVKKWIGAVLAVFVSVTAFFPSGIIFAAPLKGYEAVQVVASSKLTIVPGETKQVSVGFQNVGTESWVNDGRSYVSVYTHGPKYRTSVFQDTTWLSSTQPAKLTESSVRPGEVGHIQFALHAPATAGTYAETFQLAAEDAAWIPGGQFTINVTVGTAASGSSQKSSPSSSGSGSSSTSVSADTSGLSGIVLLRSAKKITAKANETVSYTVGIKNTGTTSWSKRSLHEGNLQAASLGSSSVVVSKTSGTVGPGAMDLIDFTFQAPSKKGSHTVTYVLAVDDAVVPDLEINIPVEVTSDAPSVKSAPVKEKAAREKEAEESTTDGIVSDITMEEPTVRIGVLIVDEETDDEVVVSCVTSWKLYDGDSGLLAELNKDESVEAFYKKDRYWYDRGKGLEKTGSYLRFVPDEENAVCKVENFDRRVTRNAAYPDNEFRNILELRYNSAKDRTWLINELDVEMYLRGLAETSNVSHLEFQKTLITVARTYALYHWERATKHEEEYFHMNAYADDQVYRGYGQESRTPRLTSSVEATEGVVVTYDGKTAITPYFSRSDGRTRDWGEVWYGDVAWLKSVPAPCDKGKTLWGHGVGMSASEALCQANNGKEWKDILKYFYTGIDLTRRWK